MARWCVGDVFDVYECHFKFNLPNSGMLPAFRSPFDGRYSHSILIMPFLRSSYCGGGGGGGGDGGDGGGDQGGAVAVMVLVITVAA